MSSFSSWRSNKGRAITVADYYKKFGSIFGGVTTAIGALPIISGLFPEKLSLYLFPPLGNVWRAIAVILAGLVTLILFFVNDASFAVSKAGRLRALVLTFAFALTGACSFLITSHRVVRAVDIPTLGKTITVTIGFERTEFADSISPQMSDWELLHQRGTSEEQIRKLWKDKSVLWARLALFTSYLLFLLNATATACFAVLFDSLGLPTSP